MLRKPRVVASLTEQTEIAIISVVVATLFAVVLVTGVLGLQLSTSVATGTILVALVAILRVSTKLYAVESDTRELLIRAQRGTNIQRFRTYPEFYKALNFRLAEAEQSLRLTHIRDDPPSAFRVDSHYYSEVEEWANTHPASFVRRVIAINNEAMRAWAKTLQAAELAHENFRVRVTSRSSGLPVINMAILDSHDVFLAISGESPEQTAGVWISDAEVGHYFTDYYDNLWNKSQPLAQALALPIDAMGTG